VTREKNTLQPLWHKALRRYSQSDVHVLRVSDALNGHKSSAAGITADMFRKKKENNQLGIDGDTRKRVCGGSLTQVSPA
jgi:hypothetical protein